VDKDYLKEAIKVEIEFLKLLFILLIGLVTGISGLAIKETFGQNRNELILTSIGIILLMAVLISLIVVLFRIINYLKKLKI